MKAGGTASGGQEPGAVKKENAKGRDVMFTASTGASPPLISLGRDGCENACMSLTDVRAQIAFQGCEICVSKCECIICSACVLDPLRNVVQRHFLTY